MNILFISLYLDSEFFRKIFDNAIEKPIQSVQKFDSLIIDGLEKNENVNKVDILTMACVNRKTSKKLFWKGKNITNGKKHFNYIPFVNLKFIKQICCFFYTILFALYFSILNLNNRKNTYVLCDGFFPIVSTVSMVILKIFGYKIMTFYTDLPKVNFDTGNKSGIIKNIIRKVINIGDCFNQKFSDCFMFLTKQMNDVVNKENKPYIIIEGLCDLNYDIEKKEKKHDKKIIFYAGGLYEKYGIKLLIDSFVKWNNKEYELWLCGSDSDLLDYILKIKNKNVKYLGALANDEVVEIEKKCHLLINPRFSNEEYTKYSFPSKTMEYMLSGTPVLTTKLHGIPNDYDEYLYYIEEESEEGLIDSFEKIDSIPDDSLDKKGKAAQKFVYENKNNNVQSNKIINFVSKINESNKNIFQIDFYLFVAFLYLFSSNLFGLGTKFIYLYYIIAIFRMIIYNQKVCIDKNSFLLMLFSVSYSIFSADKFSLLILIAPSVSYIACMNFKNIDFQKLKIIVYSIIFGLLTNVFLNLLINIGYNGRNLLDFWTHVKYSATLQGLNVVMIYSLIVYFFIYKREKLKYISIILMICFIYSLKLGTRTSFLILFIILIIELLIIICYDKDKIVNFKSIIINVLKKSKKVIFSFLIIVVTILLLNPFNIRERIMNINIFSRFLDNETYKSDSYRLNAYYEGISQLFKYPFGGNKYILTNTKYVHNLFLDISNNAGIIPFFSLLLYFLINLYKFIKVLLNKKIKCIEKCFYSSIFLSLFINFNTEPILVGAPKFLIFFIIICTVFNVYFDSKYFMRKEKNNENIVDS